MQLFALDTNHHIISARHALKQRDYFCIECQRKVRVRSGLHRRSHFFHAQDVSPCRLSTKTMSHIQTQCFLEQMLPPGQASLEWRFPEINRIADVVWFDQKMIFEVQCSPISAEEIFQRNRDYASLGYQVVWILHDKRYNQYRLSGAEMALRASPHYFTNIDADGNGMIYDQFHIIAKGLRLARLPPCPIDCSRPKDKQSDPMLPRLLQQRLHYWNSCFEGDLLDRPEDFAAACDLEERYFPKPIPRPWWRKLIDGWHTWVARPYNILFQILLERACR